MPKKNNFAPFKIKCRKCKNKMRYSGVSMVKDEYRYTCDKCEYTIVIKKAKEVDNSQTKTQKED